MQLFMSLRLGSIKTVLLAIMIVASSVLAATLGPAVQEAKAAVTADECYKLNNTVYNGNVWSANRDKQDECMKLGYCKRPSNYARLECSVAVYEASDQYKKLKDDANNAAILNAQVAPLIDIICVDMKSPAGKSECVAAIKTQYPICANRTNNMAEEGASDEQINSVIASCMRDWAKTAYPNTKIDLDKLTAAVATGRGAGNDESKKIGDEEKKKECDAKGEPWIWADGKCVEKAAVLCSGGALGWIMCPLAEMATYLTTEIAKLISSVLTFSPLLSSQQGQAIQQVWQLIVNIANVLLVIAFLAVVFSQATSVGLSNYGIKKMLPKIIAAAILMNLSFFICAVGVDVANVLGQSVAGIIQAGIDVLPAPPSGVFDGDVKAGADGGDIAMFTLISGLGLGALWLTGNLFLILPALATAVAAMATALVVIVFRQVALIIMIILSPLAFVAWVLPNTESWFEKWRKFFVGLLLMFPLIMAIFYGATFLSHIILTTLDPTRWDVNFVKALALIVLVTPLFSMPIGMRMMGGVLERVGAWANDRNKGLIDRTRNKANEWRGNTAYQRSKEARKAERQRRQAENFARKMSEDGKMGDFRRRMYGGMRITRGQKADSKAAWDNIYDEYRERVAKTTERTRGRATDAGAFTAGSKYHLERNGNMEEVDKDTWMNSMYADSKAKGMVTDLSGKDHHFDASDSSFNSAIASQAAKSGDKAMYGKLLKRSMEMQSQAQTVLKDNNASVEAKAEAQKRLDHGAELEFKLRDFGINNAGVVAGGHPDVVKGQYSAFKSISAEGLLAMDGSAVERMGAYLSHGDNTYNDLIVGAKENARVALQAQVDKGTRASFTEADVQAMADADLGRTGTDAKTGKGIYGAGRVTSYMDTARAAFEEAVYQLNTKDIYSGKAVQGGDLDKAVSKAATTMQLPNSGQIHFGNPGMQRVLSQAGGGNTAPTPAPTPVPTIQLNIPTPSGANYPQPAHQVQAQVQQAGGWDKLPPEAVMDIYNHANNLPNNADSTQLGSEALDELRNRGIMPPGSSNP